MVTCFLPDGTTQDKPMRGVKTGDIFVTDLNPEGPVFRATSDAYLKPCAPGSWVYHTCDTEVYADGR